VIAASLALLYCIAVFSPIPFIVYWRGIWIETAMTTADHQWLATAFMPGFVIDRVMAETGSSDIIGGGEFLTEANTSQPEDTDDSPGSVTESDADTPITEKPEETIAAEQTKPSGGDSYGSADGDILGLASMKVGAKDYAGNTISVVDIDEGLFVSDIAKGEFKGKIMLIDDPSRVFLGVTTKANEGLRIKDMLSAYGAAAGINASGFADPNGEGSGAELIGLSCSQGTFSGEYVSYYGSVLLTNENKLVVGNVTIWNNKGIRDGIQFGPVLVADGTAAVSGSAGYGLQPRTAIGQRSDGAIIMLVIDGRSILHSIGCTVGDMAEILLSYGCVNAACCDGGSSSVMAYGGEVINVNSSANPTLGRRLPNAFLVKSKKST